MNIYVVGADHHNTLGVVKSLGEAGVNPIVLIITDGKHSFVLKSRSVKEGHIFNTNSDCVKFLLSNKTCDEDMVLCCTDAIVMELDKHHAEITKKYRVSICDKAMEASRLMNKEEITNLASQYGLDVPKSWKIINSSIPDDIVFPCITKPLTSVNGSKKDIIVCNNCDELHSVITRDSVCTEYLVQEYIEREKEISILGTVLYGSHQVIFSGCIDKLRESSRGCSAFAVMLDNQLLGDNLIKIEKLLKDSGYNGLFSVEFLYSKGKYYFLEVNFRNDGNGYVPTKAGLNLPYFWYQSCLGRSIIPPSAKYPCYFMVELADLGNVKHGKVSLLEWIRDFTRTNCFYLLDHKDIRPFFYSLLYRIRH